MGGAGGEGGDFEEGVVCVDVFRLNMLLVVFSKGTAPGEIDRRETVANKLATDGKGKK